MEIRFTRYKKIIIVLLIILAILLRISLFKYQSSDYDIFLNPWITYFKTHGGIFAFKSIKYTNSNYNVPYLYFIALVSYLPKSISFYIIKIFSVIFDFVIALFAYKIVQLKYPNKSLPTFAAITILFLPSIFINSSFWGQCDSIYTAFIMGSIYFLLLKRRYLSITFFALALIFKLQAIFFAPVIVLMFLYGYIKLKHILIAIPIYVISIIPALILGKPIIEILQIYIKQTGEVYYLASGLANIYQWLPQTPDRSLYGIAAIILTAAICLSIYFVIFDKIIAFNKKLIIEITFIFLLIVPTFLPAMHERYFYPVEVFSVVYAFSFPNRFYIPIILQVISVLGYFKVLFLVSIIPLPILTFFTLFIVCIALYYFIKPLYFPVNTQIPRLSPPRKRYNPAVMAVKRKIDTANTRS